MRKTFILIYLIAVSYYAGSRCPQAQKDYEAACLFKDILNSAMDKDEFFNGEMENLYDEWTMDFEALEFNYLKEEDLETYYWCY